MNRWLIKEKDSVDDGGLVILARFPEPWQADMFVSLLASEGIQAYLSDEHFVRNTRHSVAIGGVGIVVREADAHAAWDLLQRAERGELSLPSESAEYSDEWNRRKVRDQKRESGYREMETRNPPSPSTIAKATVDKRLRRARQTPETRNLPVIRCPRCGSANNEKRKGLKALFSPGYRCRVCQWEWKERI